MSHSSKTPPWLKTSTKRKTVDVPVEENNQSRKRGNLGPSNESANEPATQDFFKPIRFSNVPFFKAFAIKAESLLPETDNFCDFDEYDVRFDEYIENLKQFEQDLHNPPDSLEIEWYVRVTETISCLRQRIVSLTKKRDELLKKKNAPPRPEPKAGTAPKREQGLKGHKFSHEYRKASPQTGSSKDRPYEASKSSDKAEFSRNGTEKPVFHNRKRPSAINPDHEDAHASKRIHSSRENGHLPAHPREYSHSHHNSDSQSSTRPSYPRPRQSHSPVQRSSGPATRSPPVRRHPSLERQHLSPERQHPSPKRRHPPSERRHPSPERRHLPPERRHPSPERRHLPPERRYPSPERRHPPPEQRYPSPERGQPLLERRHPSPVRGEPLMSTRRFPLRTRPSPSPPRRSPTRRYPALIHHHPSSSRRSPLPHRPPSPARFPPHPRRSPPPIKLMPANRSPSPTRRYPPHPRQSPLRSPTHASRPHSPARQYHSHAHRSPPPYRSPPPHRKSPPHRRSPVPHRSTSPHRRSPSPHRSSSYRRFHSPVFRSPSPASRYLLHPHSRRSHSPSFRVSHAEEDPMHVKPFRSMMERAPIDQVPKEIFNARRKPLATCYFCDREHWSHLCVKVNTLEERRDFYIGHRLCFNCGKDHRGKQCRMTDNTCKWPHCAAVGEHHSSLCPEAPYPITFEVVNDYLDYLTQGRKLYFPKTWAT